MKDIAIRDGFVGEKYTTEVLLENNNTIPITVIVKIDVQFTTKDFRRGLVLNTFVNMCMRGIRRGSTELEAAKQRRRERKGGLWRDNCNIYRTKKVLFLM